MAWCEANGVDYVFGPARNTRLVERIDAALAGAERDAGLSGETARRFADFPWTTRKSWSRERRVVAKAEWMRGRHVPFEPARKDIILRRAGPCDSRRRER